MEGKPPPYETGQPPAQGFAQPPGQPPTVVVAHQQPAVIVAGK